MWRQALFVCLLVAMPVLAQEGHPLTGTWTGDWGSTNAPRTHLTLVLNWEGDEKIAGVINPGPDAIPIQNIVINFTNWTVRIDAEAKDAAGKAVRVQADGKIEDLGSPRRRLSGTWRQGTVMGDFKVTREQ
jgi:hypothetical protein